MTAEEFIKKWRHLINYLGFPSVGIHVGWDIIPVDSKVESFSGKEAWEKIYNCTPPWFETPKTFRQLIDGNGTNYRSEILKEIINGKIQRFAIQGLEDPIFCAFANQDGSFILLGDGNHRFLDCSFLMNLGKDFSNDIGKTELDIIYLEKFEEVLKPEEKIWGRSYNKNETF